MGCAAIVVGECGTSERPVCADGAGLRDVGGSGGSRDPALIPFSLLRRCVAMAAVFPYRGGCAPVPTPMAPLPDYMSEEKLQEKGA